MKRIGTWDARWSNALALATGAWLMMMVAVMPLAGAGPFGLSFGGMAPIATL